MKNLIKTTEEVLKAQTPINEAEIRYGDGKTDFIGSSALKVDIQNAVAMFLRKDISKFIPFQFALVDPPIQRMVMDEIIATLEKHRKQIRD